jgi:hypothetical protein
VHRVQVNPGFARLMVESADHRTELDFGAVARLFPVDPGQPAPVLNGEELVVEATSASISDGAKKCSFAAVFESCRAYPTSSQRAGSAARLGHR